jgi:hypothetical protein
MTPRCHSINIINICNPVIKNNLKIFSVRMLFKVFDNTFHHFVACSPCNVPSRNRISQA